MAPVKYKKNEKIKFQKSKNHYQKNEIYFDNKRLLGQDV